MARYGRIQVPFREDDELKPVDPYGVSKVAAENILKILSSTHNIEYNIAVPHNIIGPKQKYDDPYRNVVSIMINLMLQERNPIIYGDGNQKRTFSDIDDCIYCLDKLITDPSIVSQVINIGPDEEFTTVKELAEICANITGYNGSFEYVPDRPQEVKHAVCSSDKARRILKYKTTTKLHKAIQETYEFIKEQGPKPFNYYLDLEIINEKTPKTWTEKKI
jgi:UDP-glucose 4-epimerase